MNKILNTITAPCLGLMLAMSPWQGNASDAYTASSDLTAKSKEVMESPGWKLGDPISFYDGKITFDIQIRERLEYRQNWIDFNDNFDIRDDVALLQRLRLGVKIKPIDWFTAYAQMQDSRTFFDEPAGFQPNREFVTLDSPADLRQAYVELGNFKKFPLSLKVGRQVLSYGDQRLIGGFEWDNNARTFDALKLKYKPNKDFWLDFFAGYVVLHNTDEFNTSDSEDLLTGLYGQYSGLDELTIEAYAIYRSKSDIDTNTTLGVVDPQKQGNAAAPGDYVTLGTLWKTKPKALGPWDANAEVAVQFGNIQANPALIPFPATGTGRAGREDLFAAAAHIEGGYTFDHAWKPRVYVEYAYASGTDNSNSGEYNTFQNLFPTNHKFYGYMDRFSWQNLHNVGMGTIFKPLDKLKIKLDYHLFWLDESTDPWRFAGQGIVGAAPRAGRRNAGSGSFVGSEIDLTIWYQFTKWFKVQGGYSHFFTGDYVRDTAPLAQPGGGTQEDDADFLYIQTVFNF